MPSPHDPRARAWRRPTNLALAGATDDPRYLAIETSFSMGRPGPGTRSRTRVAAPATQSDTLVTAAERLETALLAQGWQRVAIRPCSTKEPA